MLGALDRLWPYTHELFEADAVDEQAQATGLGPRWADLREPWTADLAPVFEEAGLPLPEPTRFRSTGRRGVHSEHLGHLLGEMQSLQRSFPGGRW
jgi:ring-1,2-phenylacetyl-CoA epoxidase subunit PaaC